MASWKCMIGWHHWLKSGYEMCYGFMWFDEEQCPDCKRWRYINYDSLLFPYVYPFLTHPSISPFTHASRRLKSN